MLEYKQWEYKQVVIRSSELVETEDKQFYIFEEPLNKYGKDGWELISHEGGFSGHSFLFKRPKVDEEIYTNTGSTVMRFVGDKNARDR